MLSRKAFSGLKGAVIECKPSSLSNVTRSLRFRDRVMLQYHIRIWAPPESRHIRTAITVEIVSAIPDIKNLQLRSLLL